MAFPRPFFKEFAVHIPGDLAGFLKKAQAQGLFAGLPAGRWYPQWPNTLIVAVTEKRTKADIDTLVQAIAAR